MNWYLEVLKKYVDFNGRARRKEYWMFTLFHIIIYYGLIILSVAVSHNLMFLAMFYILATLLPALGAGVRRMHDVGKSGWFYFIVLIPIIGAIWLLVLFFTEGNHGENQYGPDPKAVE